MAGSLILLWGGVAGAQTSAPPMSAAPTTVQAAAALNAERAGEAATFTFFNRSIVTLRARVAGHSPGDRSAGAHRLLDDLVSRGEVDGPVHGQPFAGGVILSVGSRGVLVLTAADVDELAGETLSAVADQSVARLQQALDEATEAHSPRMLLRAAAASAAVMVLALLLLWGLARARGFIVRKFAAIAERKVTEAGIAPLHALRASHVLDVQRYIINALIAALDLFILYAATTFSLRQFPYTRPWGESMRGFLFMTARNLALGFVYALPGLFTVVVIFAIVRLVIRIIRVWFDAVERGQATPRWIYPDTAQPTRRLVTTLLWLLAVIVAYPYMPGSGGDAFKGVTVFLGLMVTFGSSGLVNQVMSGFMITYSRALRVGDFVKVGEIEGTVLKVGMLSTKIKTLMQEEVTVPNAVLVSQTITDYSRFANSEGVFTPTSVTIGYDAPWRQVHALLLAAAERTPGLRRTPTPLVLQASLEDFYVKYTLLVCLEDQQARLFVLDALNQNIQDLFNEHGVQIMSPNYMVDPAAPKVVPKERWFTAPAQPTKSPGAESV